MNTVCLLIIGILCMHVDYLGGSGASVRVSGARGLGGTAVIESTEGWRVDYSIFTDAMSIFSPVSAEHACVKDVCVDYHRHCRREGEATTCSYAINFGRSVPFTVRADNDSALNMAMRNIAIYKTVAAASDFPLALLDKDTDAPSPQQAIGIAAQHAGLAANSPNINLVHTHLHHVLNCLVGPGGDGFDAMPGNPCANSGSAIPQENDAETRTKLLNVAVEVRRGISENNLADAKKIASDAQSDLRK